ncbi:phosphoglycolate phosphatase-like HAD superfamily hydrolase [Bradyrhizobium sp. F1.13.1]
MVEANGIVIGVGRAGAIAGRAQIARTFRLARAQAEMVSEQYEVLEALGLIAVEPLQRGTNPSMELDPTLQEQVLIDHVLKHGLRKAIRSQRDRVGARDLLDNLGIAQKFEPRFHLRPLRCHRTEKSRVKTGADHRGLLGQAAHLMRQPVQARQ